MIMSDMHNDYVIQGPKKSIVHNVYSTLRETNNILWYTWIVLVIQHIYVKIKLIVSIMFTFWMPFI